MYDYDFFDRLDIIECENPLCHALFHRSGTKMNPRLYCSDKCKFQAWLIKQIRGTHASLPIEQGEDLNYIKDQRGHHSITMTVDTYGHRLKD